MPKKFNMADNPLQKRKIVAQPLLMLNKNKNKLIDEKNNHFYKY
jgi:hypothetical protein